VSSQDLEGCPDEYPLPALTILVDGLPAAVMGPSDIGEATIRLHFAGYDQVVVSNSLALDQEGIAFSLDQPGTANCTEEQVDDVVWHTCEISDWDVTAGSQMTGDGLYPVYARLFDDCYESDLLMAGVGLDATPPAVLHADVTPPIAGAGEHAVLTVVFTETLDAGPGALLEVQPADGLEPLFSQPTQLGDTPGYFWTAKIMPSNQTDGNFYGFHLSATDLYQNSAAGTLADALGEPVQLGVDTLPPELVDPENIWLGLEVLGLNQAGEDLSFDFAVREKGLFAFDALPDDCSQGCPTVLLGSQQLGLVERNPALDDAGLHVLGFTYTYAVQPDDWGAVEADLGITISWTDLAGNEMNAALAQTLWADFVPPQVVACHLSPVYAGIGDTITYQVAVSEPLMNEPQLIVEGQGPDIFVMPPDVVGQTTFVWQHEVTPWDESGEYALMVEELTDLGGNEVEGAACAEAGAIDAQAPEVTGIEVSTNPVVMGPFGDVVLAVGDGGEITVTLTLSESGEAPGGPGVFLDIPGFPLEFVVAQAEPMGGDEWLYVYSMVLDAGGMNWAEGMWPIRVEATDLAGNMVSTTAESMVRIDFEPPTAECYTAPLGASPFGAGEVVQIVVFPNEELDPNSLPELVEEFEPPLGGAFFSYVADSKWVFTGEVPPSVGKHDFQVRVRLRDLVGNETSPGGNACVGGEPNGKIDG